MSWSTFLLRNFDFIDLYFFKEVAPAGPLYPHLIKGRQLSSQVDSPGLWEQTNPGKWKPCVQPSVSYSSSRRRVTGYLQVFLQGGLNQQRIGICNAVVLARLLNATLVLPVFDINPVWRDPSGFSDIFDVSHFIHFLRHDVRVVKALPPHLRWSTREFYKGPSRNANHVTNAPAHAPGEWYLQTVLPLLKLYEVAVVFPFVHRLGFDGFSPDLQRLRCRVNFGALRFVNAIEELGSKLVSRMRGSFSEPAGTSAERRGELVHVETRGTSHARRGRNSAKFLALHLRFDEDMIAHSKCDYWGGWLEHRHMELYRSKTWGHPSLANWRNSGPPPDALRMAGKCALAPEEAGLLLAALGFSNRTRLFIATHKVYGGDAQMASLHQLFPLHRQKGQLATPEELAPFQGRASQLAALDYYVCVNSDVFISAGAGNMHNVLAGERIYRGLRKTIELSSTLLFSLLGNASVQWEEFQRQVVEGHRDRIGKVRLRKEGQSVYTYPAPDCMCNSSQSPSVATLAS